MQAMHVNVRWQQLLLICSDAAAAAAEFNRVPFLIPPQATGEMRAQLVALVDPISARMAV
jgi:hypothetical protein